MELEWQASRAGVAGRFELSVRALTEVRLATAGADSRNGDCDIRPLIRRPSRWARRGTEGSMSLDASAVGAFILTMVEIIVAVCERLRQVDETQLRWQSS